MKRNLGKTKVATIVKRGSNGKSIRTKTLRATLPSTGWTIQYATVKVIWFSVVGIAIVVKSNIKYNRLRKPSDWNVILMPDYSKCFIYKLCCRDASIEEIYIGSTCNLTRRKITINLHVIMIHIEITKCSSTSSSVTMVGGIIGI